MIAGGVTTHAQRRAADSDCRLHIGDGVEGTVTGWFEGGAGAGAQPFWLVGSLGCDGSVRVFQGGVQRSAQNPYKT